jgi:uncharacterized iron-regulated membrane protein
MKRTILLLHRYLGIVCSLLMASWCLSGAVMMYVAFPSYGNAERVKDLAPLNFNHCCDLEQARTSLGAIPIDGFEISMQGERPVVIFSAQAASHVLDLRTGLVNGPVNELQAMAIVNGYLRNSHAAGSPRFLGTIAQDQWTVSEGYARHAPLHKFALDDPSGTELYVSAQTGQIVQRTTARARHWNYFGAITHWLYFTPLRRHSAVWTQLVIWLSVAGTFLTLTGLYLGIEAWRIGRMSQRYSPYRNLNLWHHIAGLVFGILTFTWVGSGLISMNPWGLLESQYGLDDAQRLRGMQLTTADALQAVAALASADSPAASGTLLQVSATPLDAHLYLTAVSAQDRQRLDGVTLEESPLSAEQLSRALLRLQPKGNAPEVLRLKSGDNYYYSDHESGFKPAYRAVLNDAERSRYYFDEVSGALLFKYDRAARGYRWIFNAVHRWDFAPGMRGRPLWDIVLLVLLLGVALGSLTGVLLSFRRLVGWLKPNITRHK